MTTQTAAPTAQDIQVINWAGRPLAEWVAKGGYPSEVNFWASEDRQWAYFCKAIPLWEKDEADCCPRLMISYAEAGRYLAQM